MDQNNKLNELIESSGAFAEACKIQHDAFVNAGFTEYEAMYLIRTFVAEAVKAGLSKGGNDD